ncbi:nitroreductase family protein [Microbacterium sp. zg.Y1090]|uniref:nitroreductase family protein n=1 Tax=Microbacterium TaxID=33882 RepID=UPI00214AE9FB|nr:MULTISPECIES: nitroreductase family protein [unclassified Microbacterium]MCR2813192.1 nitroreductase family protein [Microbacterium sp. zg.Y1084]MCR2819505.1 nitroreductase family protein [Microbacterium sp. zg.Y1090]MDL5487359.1 nitroreductase family protein [Microbacterium sp. zg-Y1211]WIM29802.1 nitroreductase family protein [Microbacterium sp. zg-Y1090]
MLDRTATTDAPILDVLASRWSTRVFDAEAPIDEAALASALEAARWAPSANNSQPWRFIVARRGTAAHDAVVATLMGFNQAWAAAASALVVFAAATSHDGTPLAWAAYDTGQAAAHFTVQAHASGLHTHQMGGFDRDALAAAFDLDSDLMPVTVMAVGTLGDVAAAPEALRERENAPRVRLPLTELLAVDA